MIEMIEKEMETFIKNALKKTVDSEKQIISMTEKIKEIDPIYFFENAKQLNKNRLFWSDHSHELFIVGVGNVYEMISDHSPFQTVKQKWNNLLKESMIHNHYEAPGTGLVSFGGMSFDPKKETTELWNKFKPFHMVIPQYTLIKYMEEYYLTITILLQKGDKLQKIINEVDRVKQILLKSNPSLPKAAVMIDKQEVSPKEWLNSVNKAIQEINDEKAKKIVMAREMRVKLNKTAEVSVILKRLLKMHENSYIFAFEQDEDCFIGATPERLVKLEGNKLLSTCLAGTAPRGGTVEEDRKIAKQLLRDEKNLEEHLYVVHMIENKIKKYCTNINIPSHPTVYTLRNLQHLYTPVRAKLNQGASIFDIIGELHPTPALGGVPRDKSLQFIRTHELLDRGWYGAPIGWLDSNQNGEFAVAIRSGLIQNDEVSLFAGCGVMKDSDPEEEYKETSIKFLPMLSVLEEDNESY